MYPVRAKGGREYVFDSVLYFNRPFGVLADCSDQLRKEGPDFSIYRISLYIDDSLWYETVFETVDYATTSSSNLEYDFQEATENRCFVRRLFRMTGDTYSGSRGPEGGDGTIGTLPPLAIGRHKARIVASDAAGNRSQLAFSFVWGPEAEIYKLDSTVNINDSNTVFHFTPMVDTRPLAIESTQVFLNRHAKWGPVPSVSIRSDRDGRLQVDVTGVLLDRRVFRLSHYAKGGCRIDEEPFSGRPTVGTDRIAVSHELTDEGLYATIKADALLGAQARLELYYQGKLLGVEYPSRYFTMKDYHFFVPPRPEYARVDEIRGVLSRDTTRAATRSDSVSLFVVGLDENQEIPLDSNTTIIVRKSGLFEPRFLELKRHDVRNRVPLRLNSDHYEIMPEVMALREPFEIRMRYTSLLPDSGRTELYRLNKKANRWEWINDRREGKELFGKMDRGGSFAAVYDFDPPIISNLSPAVGQKVRDLRPKIQFTLTDSLSGFEDDRNILIKLDGKWQIPEFDPETGICWTQPMEPLELGNHHLAVEVTDRVGNKAAQYLQFVVMQPASPRTKR